jgi:hypothetical protein
MLTMGNHRPLYCRASLWRDRRPSGYGYLVRPLTPQHQAQLEALRTLIARAGLGAHAADIEGLLRPGVGLKTRKAKRSDLDVGSTRVGGEPDLPEGVAWPEGGDEPMLFVAQARLDDVAPFDLEAKLPPRGLLSVFADSYVDHVTIVHTEDVGSLRRIAWPHKKIEPFTACGVEVRAELHLPPPSSCFVALDAPAGRPGSARRPALRGALALPAEAHRALWDEVWLKHLKALGRGGSAGSAGIHQLLGYANATDGGEQARDEEVLFAFDSDDRAGMEWGDVQCVWLLIGRAALAARDFTKVRAEV